MSDGRMAGASAVVEMPSEHSQLLCVTISGNVRPCWHKKFGICISGRSELICRLSSTEPATSCTRPRGLPGAGMHPALHQHCPHRYLYRPAPAGAGQSYHCAPVLSAPRPAVPRYMELCWSCCHCCRYAQVPCCLQRGKRMCIPRGRYITTIPVHSSSFHRMLAADGILVSRSSSISTGLYLGPTT